MPQREAGRLVRQDIHAVQFAEPAHCEQLRGLHVLQHGLLHVAAGRLQDQLLHLISRGIAPFRALGRSGRNTRRFKASTAFTERRDTMGVLNSCTPVLHFNFIMI